MGNRTFPILQLLGAKLKRRFSTSTLNMINLIMPHLEKVRTKIMILFKGTSAAYDPNVRLHKNTTAVYG